MPARHWFRQGVEWYIIVHCAGDTVCILDIGGGTADITVHDVEERGGKVVLAEALHATGAMCGGAYVDRAFM